MASLDQPLPAGTTRAPTRGWSEYTQLSRQLKQAGLLDRRHGWYAAKIALNLVLLAAGGIVFLVLGESWWQLGTAAYLAVVATQLGFVGHDAGHRQIFRRRRANDLVGLLHANLLVGISFGWWVPKHNAHHTNPNDEDLDPDIGIAALAFTAAQASWQAGPGPGDRPLPGVLVLPPAAAGGRPPPCGQRDLGPPGPGPGQPGRGPAAPGPCRAYVTVLVLVLTPLQAVAFALVQQGLFGLYLGCSFAPNHKGMPTLTQADQLDFLRRQVLTSRNVRGSRLVDFLLGGLNYQIEHHLFPNMARPNLRHAQPLVRAFCATHNLPYTEASLFGSYAQALRHLHTVGAPLRAVPES